jgi:hypothetical protein
MSLKASVNLEGRKRAKATLHDYFISSSHGGWRLPILNRLKASANLKF